MTRDEQEHLIKTSSCDTLRNIVGQFAGPKNRATKHDLVAMAINVLDGRRREEFMEALIEDRRAITGRKKIRHS